jgi:peptidoglycan hydrolase-like protein with peptidoglycan-binding domain
MSRKRISTLVIVLGLVVIVAVVGWIAGSNIITPAEAAARTAPPTPAPILVPVEERVLTSDVVTRGTARYGRPLVISIVLSAVKSSAGIITTLPVRNTQLNEGDVALTASGRPVFVLQGDIPTYRDLVPGISGDDVRQLENALQRQGFDPGRVDGTYDEQTSAAVSAWYTSAGWEPFGPTPDQLANVRALEQELVVATSAKLSAYDAVAKAALEVEAAGANAESATTAASADVGVKTRVRDAVLADPESTPEERADASADLAVAQAAEKATRAAGKAAIQAALDAHEAAQREAQAAVAAADRIAADLDIARSKTGVQAPADEIVFVPDLPVRVEQVSAAVGDAASGPALTVTNYQLAIDSSLALDEAPLVKPGMPVAIDEPDLGIKASGVVAQVADTPGTFGVDGFHIYLEVAVDETPVALEGFSLRLTIPVQSTGGAVIVVPVSALSLAADGTSRVQVDNNGSLESIVVEPGLSADGFVEVKAVDGTLAPGQLVVIGFTQQ